MRKFGRDKYGCCWMNTKQIEEDDESSRVLLILRLIIYFTDFKAGGYWEHYYIYFVNKLYSVQKVLADNNVTPVLLNSISYCWKLLITIKKMTHAAYRCIKVCHKRTHLKDFFCIERNSFLILLKLWRKMQANFLFSNFQYIFMDDLWVSRFFVYL